MTDRAGRDRPRRFGLMDALILIAAVAVGVTWTREGLYPLTTSGRAENFELNSLLIRVIPAPPFAPIGLEWAERMGRAALLAEPTVACVALALVALRLRRPRPGFRRLVRQPGMAAGIVAAVGLAVMVAECVAVELGWHLLRGQPSPPLFAGWAYRSIPHFQRATPRIAVAVIAAWTLLALGRLTRPGRDWPDRAGVALGLAWVTLTIIQGGIQLAWQMFS